MQCKPHRVKNTPRKGNRMTQATQEVANDMAGICHMIWWQHTPQSLDKLTHF